MRGQRLVGFRRSWRAVASRRQLLRGVIAGAVALLAPPAAGYAFQGSGSISVQGFLCPSADADLSDCQATDEIFNGDIMISGPDGLVLTLDDGESHAVSHVWDGLPYGAYDIQALGASPSGYALDHVDGATDDGGWGKEVDLSDDNPSASVNLIYVPW
jgi:hypothetical protein